MSKHRVGSVDGAPMRASVAADRARGVALLWMCCAGALFACILTLSFALSTHAASTTSSSTVPPPVISIALPGDGETLAATVTVTAVYNHSSGDSAELWVANSKAACATCSQGSVSFSFDSTSYRNGATPILVRLLNVRKELLGTACISVQIQN